MASTFDRTGTNIDKSTQTLMKIDYTHHEIHEGNHYTLMYGVSDIGALTTPNDMMTLTFSTPDTRKWSHMVMLFLCVGQTLCQIREGGSTGASPTGAITAYNNNRNSSNTSGLLDIGATAGRMSYDATADSGGSLIVNEYIPGATTNQGKAGANAESSSRFEWVLKQNTRYQISMTQTANVGASIVLHWYEHTDKVSVVS